MEIQAGNTYRPIKTDGSDFTEQMLREINGSNIRVIGTCSRAGFGPGNVKAFEVLDTGKKYFAGQGEYNDYWCFFIKEDFENHFELVKDAVSFNHVVRTTSTDGKMHYHEPMSLAQAQKLAISQKENALPGVEVHILKIVEEVVQTIVTRAV